MGFSFAPAFLSDMRTGADKVSQTRMVFICFNFDSFKALESDDLCSYSRVYIRGLVILSEIIN